MGLITIIPPIEAVSFGFWSLMPMQAHKSRVGEYDHYWSGKGITTINIGYKVPAHSLNIQIVLHINIWETMSICSCKQGINPLQYPTLLLWTKGLCEVNHSIASCSWLWFPMVSQIVSRQWKCCTMLVRFVGVAWIWSTTTKFNHWKDIMIHVKDCSWS
jgi:hypothetical protein